MECAVPVRGLVLGPECLGDIMGNDDRSWRTSGTRRALRPGMAALGGLFLASVLLTLVPWTRFGSASGALDAWRWPQWSLLVAAVAALGLGLWAYQWWRPRMTDRTAGKILAVLAGTVAVGSSLAALFPPALTRTTPLPVIECVVALAGVAASVRVVRRSGGGRG